MKIKSYLLWLLFVCIVGIHSISALNIKDNNVVTESGYTMTYDHLAISQSYTFSSSGLGGVVYFSNNTYRGYYDGMGGVYISPRTI